MSHLRCRGCGVMIADRGALGALRPCPRCLLRRGVIVRMELDPPRPSRRVLGGVSEP